MGLLGEVVTNISAELLELLNGVQQRRETAALQDTGRRQGGRALAVLERQSRTRCETWRPKQTKKKKTQKERTNSAAAQELMEPTSENSQNARNDDRTCLIVCIS